MGWIICRNLPLYIVSVQYKFELSEQNWAVSTSVVLLLSGCFLALQDGDGKDIATKKMQQQTNLFLIKNGKKHESQINQ